METISKKKEFDCLEMKKEIQTKIYAEIKDMTADERVLYFHIPPEQDPYRQKSLKI
jgi:hypothetical protein